MESTDKDENSNTCNNMEKCYENYILIDIGANLTNKKYSRDLDAVIQRAKDSGNMNIMQLNFSL